PFNPSTASGLAMAAASTIASRVGTVRPANLAAATRTIETLPKEIDELRGTPEGAHALCAVLLADSGSLSADSFEPKVAALLGPARAAVRQPGISLTQKVISLNLALPSLSSLSTDAKEGLLATLRVIALQGSEWFPPFDAFILLTLLRAQLLTARRNTGKLNDPDTRIFLSLVAAQAGDSPKRVESFAKSTAFMGKTLMGSIHPGAFRLDAVWEAIDRLRAEAPAVREKMINAMEIAVLADNAVTESEEQLLRMLCLISGCPVPLSISCGDSADPVASRP
ncbi:MAG: hypothetical protein EBX52_05340, partial [Proteobacteria bacterium]|nr:hypothetical protein [Pseudomonadota bacterium]